jgi:hypothetical protein
MLAVPPFLLLIYCKNHLTHKTHLERGLSKEVGCRENHTVIEERVQHL